MVRCNKCGKVYSSVSSLAAHRSRIHSNRLHPTIKTHHNAFKMLESASDDNYKRIVDNTPSMIKAIKKLCQHILNGNLKLEQKHVRKLKPHRKIIRKIAHKPHRDIKGTIQTGGSILQSIISTVLPIIAALL